MQQAAKKTWPLAALVVVMALILGAVGGYLLRSTTDDGSDTTADPGDTGTISIRLEPANYVGPDPFSPEPFAPEPDPAVATVERVPVDTVELTLQITEEKPAAPGLYGGSGENVCEVEPMIEFLEADPAKAKAWVDVQNADPLLRWDQTLTVDNLGDYLRSLTPATLAADTLVTNHSYSNGVATPIVSLLQAGTAVLVDAYGVPRAKCYCGNPLTPAPPLEGDFELDEDSDPWPNAGRGGTRPNPDPDDPTTDIRQNTCDAFRRSNVPSDEWPPRCRPAPGTEPGPTATPEATPSAEPEPTPTTEPTPTPEPTATPVPAPTATPDPGTAPTLTFVEQTENPGGTGCDGLRPVQLTISYSDADGDAIGTVLQSGTAAGSYSTITGDGSSGTITVGQCIGSPATLEFTLVDQAGNESAVLGIPVA